MAAVTERQILDALGRIVDPEKGADIVSLGMVSGVVIRDGKVLQPLENYGLRVMSMGFLVPEDTPMIWRGPMPHGPPP